MRIQRFSEHTPMPWANGRGTSFEVARDGGDDWSWRVAIAPVVDAGQFSSLPGVARYLVVMDDAPLGLVIDGEPRVVQQGELVSFAGESLVESFLPKGPTRDCGLMVRRGRATGSMTVVSCGEVNARILVAVTVMRVECDGEEVSLEPGDAMIGPVKTSVRVFHGLGCAIGVGS
ncbi:MAG: HutD family protein [Ilumatobacteraceae bacterium]